MARINRYRLQHGFFMMKAVKWEPITVTPTANAGDWTFKADDVITTCNWDQFRIKKVVCEILPRSNVASNDDGQRILYGETCIDYDDAGTAGTGATQPPYRKRALVRTMASNRRHVRIFRPRPLMTMYESSTATGYALGMKGLWIDAADLAMVHYGLKWWFESPGQGHQYNFLFKTTFYIQLKGYLGG